MLDQYRRNRDEFFRSSDHSPLDDVDRSRFLGLRYFPPNPDLVFTAALNPSDNEPVPVATSDGDERAYRRVGTIDLALADTTATLTLFDAGHRRYFLPFRDATSGRETYGAGRYLDVHPSPDNVLTIDFNLAYNPFCAYRSDYSCALPPVENWLTVSIEAGELEYIRGEETA